METIQTTNVEIIKPKINIIVACTKNNVIGINQDLPWKLLKDDMLHFKNTTTNHVCIMGFNTWASFNKRPLPNRINIVITSKSSDDPALMDYSKGYDYSKTWFVHSIDDALFLLEKDHVKFGTINEQQYLREIFVIGGGMTYEHFMNLNLVDKIIMTQVQVNVIPDLMDHVVYFPEIDTDVFGIQDILSNQIKDERNEAAFSVVVYEKR